METIKTIIIKYLESKGHASKSQICDYLRDVKGTMGETTGRRLRELIKAEVIEKFETQTPLLENPYTAYRVVEEELEQEEFDCTVCCRPLMVCKCD